jgi:hypothetical protein
MTVDLSSDIVNQGSAGNFGGKIVWINQRLFSPTIPLDQYGREKILTGVSVTIQNMIMTWSLSPNLPVPYYASDNIRVGNSNLYHEEYLPLSQGVSGSSVSQGGFFYNYSSGDVVREGDHYYLDCAIYFQNSYWDDRSQQYYNSISLQVTFNFDSVIWYWAEAPAPLPGTFSQNAPQMVGSSVSLSWTASAYASYYKIFRAEGTHTSTATGTWQQINGNLTGNNYTDTSVTPDTTYTYYIQSFNESGTATSNFRSILTTNAPLSFSQNTPTMDNGAVALSWTTSNYATSYKIYRAEGIFTNALSGTWIEVATTTNTNYNDSSIILGRTYSYYIKAINGAGSIDSDFKNITTAPPSTFVQNEPTYQTGTSNVVVSWEASANATSYKVYRLDGYSHDTINGVWAEKATTTSLTWTDTSVILGETYSYYIKAFNNSLTTNSNPRQITVGTQQQQIL